MSNPSLIASDDCDGMDSLSLGVEMKTIAREYADRVGYQIGDKIFTYSTLVAFSLLTPAMMMMHATTSHSEL